MIARLAPQVDVLTLQAAVESLRADIDMILEARVTECESPSVEPTEVTVMAALFATSKIPPPPPPEHAKRRKVLEEDEARAQKKEHRDMEAARRSSLADEDARWIRAVESEAGASRSRDVAIVGGTADSAVVAEDTTEGVHIAEDVGSGEPDPQSC